MAGQKLTDRFSELSRRERYALILAFLLAVALLPYSVLYAPSARKLSKERAELASIRKEVDAMSSSASALSHTEEAKVALPAAEDLAGMISAITKEANRANLEFISLTPETLTQKDGYTEMKVKIELRLRFRALHDFLLGLEERQKLFIVKELKFETNEAIYPSGISIIKATAYVRR
jgi:type II secretory pathway component PulM